MKYTITLANCGFPAVVAQVEVEASSQTNAQLQALAADYDSLTWTDAAGHEVPWQTVEEQDVHLAEAEV